MSCSDKGNFYLEANMEAPEIVDVGAGCAVVFAAPCPYKETVNEDAALLLPVGPESCILAVADGLGGQPNGHVASALALKTLENVVLKSQSEGVAIREAVLQGIEAANEVVLKQGAGSATTLSVVEIYQSTVRPFQIGDSIILIVGQRGKLKYQAMFHSPTGYALESGLMNEDEALAHEERYLVSNVVGDANMRVDLGPPIELNDFDTVLLASDGIADNFTIDEIVQRIRKGPLKEAAESLAAEAHKRMVEPQPDQPSKADDYTFICYRRRCS